MTDSTYVVADIGGTHARFACTYGGRPGLHNIQVFNCVDYAKPLDAIEKYTREQDISRVAGYCLAVATHIDRPLIKLVNSHWQFNKKDLAKYLGAPLLTINDFTANAYALNMLGKEDYLWLSASMSSGKGSKVILGPGTGLGVAIVTDRGEIIPSEGGHIGFAPHTKHESLLLTQLLNRYKRVSVERVLSGNGLANLYWANAALQGKDAELTPAEVTRRATEGDAIARFAVGDFFKVLASFVSDMALLSWSKGGVYLTGGLLDKIWPFYDSGVFFERLADKGRFSGFCESLPVARIAAEYPGLMGCAYAVKQEMEKNA